jgi:hypothetical protein
VGIQKDTHLIIHTVGCEIERNLHYFLTVNICQYEITGLEICLSVVEIIGFSDTEATQYQRSVINGLAVLSTSEVHKEAI